MKSGDIVPLETGLLLLLPLVIKSTTHRISGVLKKQTQRKHYEHHMVAGSRTIMREMLEGFIQKRT